MKKVSRLCSCSCAPQLGQFATIFTQSFMKTDDAKWLYPPDNGYGGFDGNCVWTDGVNIYYSGSSNANIQYILENGAWKKKTWKGRPPSGGDVWTDGTNIYYSNVMLETDYILNGDTWESKTWNINLNTSNDRHVSASAVWTDGTNVYHTFDYITYVLQNGDWVRKYWDGDNRPRSGSCIWTDGAHIYSSDWGYSDGKQTSEHYILNGNTWEVKVWNVETIYGSHVWADGTNIYCTGGMHDNSWAFHPYSYILKNGIWEEKRMIETKSSYEYGYYVWTDGTNIFYSYCPGYDKEENAHAILLPSTAKLYIKQYNSDWIGPCSIS